MTDVVPLTPREIATRTASLNKQNVTITDEEYVTVDPALRIFSEEARENLGLSGIAGFLRNAGCGVKWMSPHGHSPTDEVCRPADLIAGGVGR